MSICITLRITSSIFGRSRDFCCPSALMVRVNMPGLKFRNGRRHKLCTTRSTTWSAVLDTDAMQHSQFVIFSDAIYPIASKKKA